MLKSEFQTHLKKLCTDLFITSESGQKEYALNTDAFDNFDRLADKLGLDRKQILMVYMEKHLDGIVSYIKGHRSQRESVHGRIRDAMVYLALLDAMIMEEEAFQSEKVMHAAMNSVRSSYETLDDKPTPVVRLRPGDI